jgi:hypothetical protein
MRILVENAAYTLLNVGDRAMTEVAVSRLHELWPEATIQVSIPAIAPIETANSKPQL